MLNRVKDLHIAKIILSNFQFYFCQDIRVYNFKSIFTLFKTHISFRILCQGSINLVQIAETLNAN